ncbi:MAG: TonB-dependent receptor [Bacteroidales bacterium]|nr:TonB-dependent receptor [Bacteroidales bacterium]
MSKQNIILLALFLFMIEIGFSQKTKTDANVFGHVICTDCDEHLSFSTVQVKGTTIGTTTDETGHYQLINLPEGPHKLIATYLGYKPQEIEISVKKGETREVNFELEKDALGLEEVVVSADRAEQKRTEAPVIVNTISPQLFNTSQSVTLGEGLNFSPGLRLENNCQNCGFSQVRMNGMEGPYSQILINSRPVFSGLAGVYGLELIPSNMIEKVEVVRGGGSALFGSNAIAGTINIIVKEPKTNSYEAGATYALPGIGTDGEEAPDYTVNFNTSVVSDDSKSGVSLYGFTRKRGMYDANNDGFSEIAPLENLTFGAKAFHKFGYRDKLSVDFFGIKEQRDGGSDQGYPLHQRKIAESVTHNLKVAAVTYERYFRKYDLLSVFASGQFLHRDSYYGAGYSTKDYGNSRDNTSNLGFQYKAVFDVSSMVAGFENTSGFLTDKKLGAPVFGVDDEGETIIVGNNPHTLVADQSLMTTGLFAQYDISLGKFKALVGARFDHYIISDKEHEGEDKSGDVISPRASLMYNILDELQARATFSQGYRAPQIFDEDLHINTSDLLQVIHVNDPDLKQETSHSFMASLDFNRLIGTVYTGFLAEGFYTRLEDAFANELGDPDENNIVTYTRVNSTGAVVRGVNMELRLKPLNNIEMSSGFTLQKSGYEEEQGWGDKKFLRTPDQYVFFAIDWDFYKGFCLSATGNYTGSMLVLYEGIEEKPGLYTIEVENEDGGIDEVQLFDSESFFDLGVKLSYTVKLNGASVQFLGGIKNVFNSYQSDFDSGIERDPAYIYGPVSPRTIYAGIRFGNLLK